VLWWSGTVLCLGSCGWIFFGLITDARAEKARERDRQEQWQQQRQQRLKMLEQQEYEDFSEVYVEE
jgi:hypothetical protein